MTKREKLINLLQEMNDCGIVMLHNEYCYKVNNFDDEIFTIDMFDEILQGSEPWDIATKVFFGDFNPSYEYFKFNAYGNIKSLCKWELYQVIDISEIVDYIIKNNCYFDNDEILYILDDIEEDSEQFKGE